MKPPHFYPIIPRHTIKIDGGVRHLPLGTMPHTTIPDAQDDLTSLLLIQLKNLVLKKKTNLPQYARDAIHEFEFNFHPVENYASSLEYWTNKSRADRFHHIVPIMPQDELQSIIGKVLKYLTSPEQRNDLVTRP